MLFSRNDYKKPKCCAQTKKPPISERFYDCKFTVEKVRAGRLELPHLAALDPKSSVSTNSTTPALKLLQNLGLSAKASANINNTFKIKSLNKKNINFPINSYMK